MTKHENPPAFPGQTKSGVQNASGMTLRDWFAGQALNGILAGPASRSGVPMSEWFDAPAQAYRLADALLAERNRPRD